MKKIFYAIFCTIIVLPVTTNALTRPGRHGLADEIEADALIGDIIDLVAGIIASLAILMIIISGIMYITSGGDTQRAETAKKMLTYSIAGLVVALLAYVIVTVIGNKLGAW